MPSSPADPVPRLKRLLPRLKGKRIGVLGDLMLDRYLWGTATRLSPEAAVPVVDFVEQRECLGGAGNVAANLAALGARVEVFGAIGGEKGGKGEARHHGEDAHHRAPPAGRSFGPRASRAFAKGNRGATRRPRTTGASHPGCVRPFRLRQRTHH